MDAGGRATPGAVAEKSVTPRMNALLDRAKISRQHVPDIVYLACAYARPCGRNDKTFNYNESGYV